MKYNVASPSMTEAKYRGVVNVGTEAFWIHQLLVELGLPVETSTVLHCYNQSAIQFAYNPIANSKMKHVELISII